MTVSCIEEVPVNAQLPCSAQEWEARKELAAAYRLMALFDLDDSIYTHISVRVPGRHDQFLINPYGMLFRDITASSLVKVGLDGQLVEPSDYDVNPAGFTIHSAIHSAREDALCIVHTHTIGGVAVASMACGLQPCNQWALQFYQRVAYHDYEGIALNHEERERLVRDMGPEHKALILRNHGLLTVGTSVAEAFILMVNLERACRVQLAIQSSGQIAYQVPTEVCELTASQYETGESSNLPGKTDPYAREWRAMKQRLAPASAVPYDA